MGNLGARDNHHFFRDSLVDENSIALAHARASFSSSPSVHGPKLPLLVLAGKSIFPGLPKKKWINRNDAIPS